MSLKIGDEVEFISISEECKKIRDDVDREIGYVSDEMKPGTRAIITDRTGSVDKFKVELIKRGLSYFVHKSWVKKVEDKDKTEKEKPIVGEFVEAVSKKELDEMIENKTKKEEMAVMEKKTEGKKGVFGKMNFMKGFNMKTLEDDDVAMGIDGKTYYKRKNGDYVRYDAESKMIVNTHDLKFDFGMAMIIPSATVEEGDMIVNNDSFVSITSIKDNRIFGISLNTGRTVSIVVERSAIGFSFYQKVVNMMGENTNVFGGMNPMMLMMMNKEEGKSSDMMEMMVMSQMMGGNVNMFGLPQQAKVKKPKSKVEDTKVVIEELTEDEIDAEIERLSSLKADKTVAKDKAKNENK